MVEEAECDRALCLCFFVWGKKNKYLLNTTKSYLNHKVYVEKSSDV